MARRTMRAHPAADPVGLAATAMAAGVALGLAVIGVTVLGVDTLRPRTASAGGPGLALYLLLLGTAGGAVAAGGATWRLLGPIGSTYRRGGFALVSAFATLVLMLVFVPVNQALGRPGLGVAAALSAALSVLLLRRARRVGPGP